MKLFLLLVFGVLLWFIFRPLFQVGKIIWKFNRAAKAARQPERDQRSERKGGWSEAPTHPKKKIDPSVGEYVSFEEVTAQTETTYSDGSTTTTTVTESQITDVEWEDL